MQRRTMWRSVSWMLGGAFLAAGALDMAGVSAGFATNHLADVVGPAWLYVVFRGFSGKRTAVGELVGATPERAAIVLFGGSTLTEVTQIYWPTGMFAGRFDPLDIAAFAVGIVPLYLIDRKLMSTEVPAESPSSSGAA